MLGSLAISSSIKREPRLTLPARILFYHWNTKPLISTFSYPRYNRSDRESHNDHFPSHKNENNRDFTRNDMMSNDENTAMKLARTLQIDEAERPTSKRTRRPSYMTLSKEDALQLLHQDSSLPKTSGSAAPALHRRTPALSWDFDDVFQAASYLHQKTTSSSSSSLKQ